MKTKTIFFILVCMTVFCGCSSNYRMTTLVHSDGTVDREVFAYADSNYISGKRTSNPFLFSIKDWKVVPLDSNLIYTYWGEEVKLNIKASRSIKANGELSFFSTDKQNHHPLAVPKEKLDMSFKWFYTYYTFSCKYSKIVDKGPVPIDRYLNDDQQRLFFQGDMTHYQGMNGIELNETLSNLEGKFMEWYNESIYQLCWGAITEVYATVGDTAYLSRLAQAKEKLRSMDTNSQKKDLEYTPSKVCQLLDIYFKTNHFTQFLGNNKKEIDKLLDKKEEIINFFEARIKYELLMPGKLISTNAVQKEGERLVWKVDAYRLLGHDYTLNATSRKMNTWAFVVTGLLILLSVYGCYRLRHDFSFFRPKK